MAGFAQSLPFPNEGAFFQCAKPSLIWETAICLTPCKCKCVGGSTGYSDWSDPVSHMAM
ncbi:MAG: hypothetical protein ACREFE_18375 [Limisphaerales bacterium]